jgi:hypothetical protein
MAEMQPKQRVQTKGVRSAYGVAQLVRREINVQVKRRYHTRAWWRLTILATALLVGLSHVRGGTIPLPAIAGEVQLFMAQAPATQDADPNKSTGEASVTRGMGKEAVRTVWGDPEEIRKIRTCFGWQEEWVYRGDQKRFGASERVLLFDEGEVLTEIK